MHPYYPAGQLPPCMLHGCTDCVRPVRFAPCDWTADGTFISLILAAVNLLNFLNSQLQGDFCVTASQLSHTNERRESITHREKMGSEMKAPVPWTGWPLARLPPARMLRRGKLLRVTWLLGRQAVPLQGAWILSHCAFPYSLWRERISVPLRRTSRGGDVGQALQSRLPQTHCSPTRAAQLLDQSANKEPCICSHRRRVTCQDFLTTSGGMIICADITS